MSSPIGRVAGIGAALLLAGCQAVTPPTSQGAAVSPGMGPAAAQPGGHLYVSSSTSTHYRSIERFRLVNGIPRSKPDRVYNGYGGLLAVAGDGTLYVVGFNSRESLAIDAFPPNAEKPNREITFPDITRHCHEGSGGTTTINAVAADAAGYLFVGIYTYAQSSRFGPSLDRRDSRFPWPCTGVAIYDPMANGKAKPVQVIRYKNGPDVQNLAVDASDDLFVDLAEEEVDEFANAVTGPKEARVFKSTYTGYPHSVATDAAGNLFVASTSATYTGGRIERYGPKADGYGKPTSTIVLPSGLHVLQSIADRGRILYVDDLGRSVDLYRAFKDGNQSPFYSLTASNVFSVAAGP